MTGNHLTALDQQVGEVPCQFVGGLLLDMAPDQGGGHIAGGMTAQAVGGEQQGEFFRQDTDEKTVLIDLMYMPFVGSGSEDQRNRLFQGDIFKIGQLHPNP